MKICPFISHMIGEDRIGILEADNGPSATTTSLNPEESAVVVLGYGAGGVVKSKSNESRKTKVKNATDGTPSHLFCLQETCRFYLAESKACQFDSMFDLAEAHSEGSKSFEDAIKKTTVAMSKDLDKFWKFQTKSAAELISSFGDVEKRQKDALAELKTELSEKIGAFENKEPKVDLKPFREEITKLQEALIAREDGMEDFSTTLSEIVLSVEDGMKAIKRSQDEVAEKIGEIDFSGKALASLHDRIESVIEDKFSAAADEADARHKGWENRLAEMSRKQDELAQALKTKDSASADDERPRQRQKNAKKLNNLGVSSFHNGDLELAREQFLESISIDEHFAAAHNNLGLACSELGDENAASSAFTKAIELDPELHAAYNNLGYLFYKQNSFDQAIEMYNEALGRQSDNSTAYTNLGNAYYKLGREEDAQAAWEKAVELDPANEKAGSSLRRLEV